MKAPYFSLPSEMETAGRAYTCHGRWMCRDGKPGLVSVIIPTYNRSQLLAEAIESVWNQTYRPIEILVIDDGSTDGTRELVSGWCTRCASADGFTVRGFHQGNCGAPVARNLGLIESRGEFIQFLDSDDLLSPKKIEIQVRALSSQERPSLAYGSWRKFSSQGRQYLLFPQGYVFSGPDYLNEWLPMRGQPVHCFLWCRDVCVQQGPWIEDLASDQDVEYLLRALISHVPLVHCSDSWSYWRVYLERVPSISSNNSERSINARIRVCRLLEQELKARGDLDRYRNGLAQRYYLIARRAALSQPSLFSMCMHEYHRLRHPRQPAPGSLAHRLTAMLIGLQHKEALSHMWSLCFGYRRERAVGVVNTIDKVSTFDVD